MAERKREIAKRYRDQARRKRGGKPFTLAAVRVSELTRLYRRRYGPGREALPADDDGELAARIMVHHLARLKDAPRRISDWLNYHAPWYDLQSRERLICDATECPIRWRADKLAWKLRVTNAERQACGLRTIGAIDLSRAERLKLRKAQARARDRARRQAQGAQPRAAYLAKIKAAPKPWAALKMSRAAWYRAGKPLP